MALKKGEEGAKENQEEQKQFSAEDIEKIVESLVEKRMKNIPAAQNVAGGVSAEQIESIIKTVATAMKKDVDIDYEAGITEEQIPPDDYDRHGVQFCVPYTGYVLADDIRQGQRVLLPYKKKFIFFVYNGTKRSGRGRYETSVAIATYTSYSKKEQQWLRDHTLYNTVFFENTTIASNQDVMDMQRLAEIMKVLGSLELPSLLRRCDENDVPKSNNIASMCHQVAHKILAKEKLQGIEKTKAVLEDVIKAKSLLADKSAAATA